MKVEAIPFSEPFSSWSYVQVAMRMDFLLCFLFVFCGSDNTSVTDLADFACKGTFCAEFTSFSVRKRENKATSISGGRFGSRIDLICCNR